jgi:signal transduction histidine kinase
MQIKTKLTLQFVFIFGLLILLSSFAIYYFSASYRSEEFYSRLESKAKGISQLLIQEESIDAEILGKIERNNPSSLPEETIRIYNKNSQLIFSKGVKEDFIDTSFFFEELRKQNVFMIEINKKQHVGFLFENDDENYIVLASGHDKFGYNKLDNLRNVLLIVFFSSLILVFVAGRIYSQKALEPINKMVEQVNNIGAVNLNSRLEESKHPDEIGKLISTFNQLLERLELAFVSQKNFIANASHELRTPLTAMRGELEVVLMKKRKDENYRETIKSVLEEIKNMIQISNNLLLLAQTDSENPDFEIVPVRVDEVLWNAIQKLKTIYPEYNIVVNMNKDLAEESFLTIAGNVQLLKTSFMNLMDNACKYSDDHRVEINLFVKDHQLVIEFTDKGIGVSEEDMQHLFEPFFRSKNARSYYGHGIGLSLVERIIRMHKGDILFWSKPDEGTKVSLLIPLTLQINEVFN